MSCYYPNVGYMSVADNDNGNRYITFNHREGYQDLKVFLPCGKCIGCRLEYARWWALRCINEAQMHKKNCFVTLTYNDENIPEDGGLVKKDLQKFHRKVKSKYGNVRYFSCGEYGDSNTRPHYHTILFGYSPQDKRLLKSRKIRKWKGAFRSHDFDVYDSKEVVDFWQEKGFITVGDVSVESAGYVARYSTKKIKGEQAKEVYGEKTPPFAMMSKRPGIGTEWIKKYAHSIYGKDYYKHNGRILRPPRFYDNWLKENMPERYKKIKADRARDAKRLPDQRENSRIARVKEIKVREMLRRSLHDNDKLRNMGCKNQELQRAVLRKKRDRGKTGLHKPNG